MTIFLSNEDILEEITFLESLNISQDLFIQYMLSCPLVSLNNDMVSLDKSTYIWFEELIELLRKAQEEFSRAYREEFIEQHIKVMFNSIHAEHWFTTQEDLKQALVDAMNPMFFMVATKTSDVYLNIEVFDEELLDLETIKQCSFLQLLKHPVGDNELERIMDILSGIEDDDDHEYVIAKKFMTGSLRDKLEHFLKLDTSEDFYVIAHGDAYEFEIKRALERDNNSIHLGRSVSNEGYGYSEYFYLDDEDRVYYSNLQKQIMESDLSEKKKSNLINDLEWEIVKLINAHQFEYYEYFSLNGIVDQALEDEEGLECLREILESIEVS